MQKFFTVLLHYIIKVTPSILAGFLLSGVIYEFLPQNWIDRYLTKKGILPILYVTVAGIFLPLCCFGSVPVAIGFRKKGVALGPVLAFLVATPATSITAILVTWRLLGGFFTLYLALSVIVMGLVIGIIGNNIRDNFKKEQEIPVCDKCGGKHEHHREGPDRIKSVFSYGLIDMPKNIGKELLIGLVLAALVASITPVQNIIENYLSGSIGYLFALVAGLVMYICSTASVPLVHAFTVSGLNTGAGLVLLIVGPITSYGTLLVLKKEFGRKVLLAYLSVVSILAVVFGYFFTLI